METKTFLPAVCAMFLLTSNFFLSKRRLRGPHDGRSLRLLYHPIRYHLVTGISIFVLSFLVTNLVVSSRMFGVIGATQGKEKVLEKGFALPNQPVEILEPKQSDKLLKFGEAFQGNEDWLKDVSIRLRNVSKREIVFVQVDFDFPETSSTGSKMYFPLSFGHHPNRDNTAKTPLFLPPGAEMDVVFDAKAYQELTRFVGYRQSIGSVNRAVVIIGFVIFSDGLGYDAGYYVRRDVRDPKRWIPITDERGDPITPPEWKQ